MKISWLACILAGAVSGQANLITNGSFENPVVPVGSFENFIAGSTGITGWTVDGPEVSIVNGAYTSECCAFPAEDGNQWLDLTGDESNSLEGVQQTVATVAGTQYNLSFWVGNTYDPGGIYGKTSTVDVLLGGVDGSLLGAFTNHSTTKGTLMWEQFSTSFTATGSSTTLVFLNADPASDNSNGLDNISLVAGTAVVPEPSVLPFVGAGLFGFALVRRRVRSVKQLRG